MAEPTPKTGRKYSSPYLSDHLDGKIIVTCDLCGMRRRYDSRALLNRLDEDTAMPDLVIMLAQAEGCGRAVDRKTDKPCGLKYDLEAMAETTKEPR
jgi:hypothetical protein